MKPVHTVARYWCKIIIVVSWNMLILENVIENAVER
jgi:hypothetical protein